MSDSSIQLNAISALGDTLDAELVGALKRERIQIGGSALAEVARVVNAAPGPTNYALAVRQVPVTTQLGAYHFSTTVQSVSATAQNATATGFLWLQNPTANTKNCRLWTLTMQQASLPTAADMATAPRILAARFTFTGTASGATNAVAKQKTSNAANTCDVRTAVTGMTVTLGNPFTNLLVPTIDFTSASGIYTFSPPGLVWRPRTEPEIIDLVPGEGIVIYQPDAGTTTDTRRFTVAGTFDEYTP